MSTENAIYFLTEINLMECQSYLAKSMGKGEYRGHPVKVLDSHTATYSVGNAKYIRELSTC
jgi:hypothetical protein